MVRVGAVATIAAIASVGCKVSFGDGITMLGLEDDVGQAEG